MRELATESFGSVCSCADLRDGRHIMRELATESFGSVCSCADLRDGRHIIV
jgi:hypothetical protein